MQRPGTRPVLGLFCCSCWALLAAAAARPEADAAGDFFTPSSPQDQARNAIVVGGSVVEALSLVAALLGALELSGAVRSCCCSSWVWACTLALLLQLPLVAAASWVLATGGIVWMVVFIVVPTVNMAVHALLLMMYYLRHRDRQATLATHRQQLLASRPRTSTTLSEGQPETAQANPFRLATGMIPGTSQYGYIVFLPDDACQSADQARPYTNLPGGKPRTNSPQQQGVETPAQQQAQKTVRLIADRSSS